MECASFSQWIWCEIIERIDDLQTIYNLFRAIIGHGIHLSSRAIIANCLCERMVHLAPYQLHLVRQYLPIKCAIIARNESCMSRIWAIHDLYASNGVRGRRCDAISYDASFVNRRVIIPSLVYAHPPIARKLRERFAHSMHATFSAQIWDQAIWYNLARISDREAQYESLNDLREVARIYDQEREFDDHLECVKHIMRADPIAAEHHLWMQEYEREEALIADMTPDERAKYKRHYILDERPMYRSHVPYVILRDDLQEQSDDRESRDDLLEYYDQGWYLLDDDEPKGKIVYETLRDRISTVMSQWSEWARIAINGTNDYIRFPTSRNLSILANCAPRQLLAPIIAQLLEHSDLAPMSAKHRAIFAQFMAACKKYSVNVVAQQMPQVDPRK